MVVLPGASGDLGVLHNHAPTVVTLKDGVIDIYEKETVKERIFVGGGFANINEDGCTVMANEAVPISDIKEANLKQHIEEVKKDLEMAEEEDEKEALRQDMKITMAQIDLIKRLIK